MISNPSSGTISLLYQFHFGPSFRWDFHIYHLPYSIRINDQFRICFVWRQGNAYQVEIVDYHQVKQMTKLKNIHPGDILFHEFLEPMGINQNKLARDISVPPRRINEIVLGKRAITADTALRLARYFGSSEKFWLGLQDDYELEEASIKLGKTLNQISAVA